MVGWLGCLGLKAIMAEKEGGREEDSEENRRGERRERLFEKYKLKNENNRPNVFLKI